MSSQRTLLDTGFPDDDGTAPRPLAEALAVYREDPDGGYLPALAVLAQSRLLVPVVAVAGEVEYDENGLAHDKTSDMATVLMTAPDGRRALLAFTSMDELNAWNPEGRPVPVHARVAAQSALQDGATTLLIDIAGDHLITIEGSALAALAKGWTPVRLDDGGWGWQTDGD